MMHSAFSSFPRSFDSGKTDDAYMLALAGLAWIAAAGRTVSDRTRAVAFESGRLTIATNDPLWQQNLDTMRSRYLSELRLHAPDLGIKQINFIVDPDLVLPESPRPVRIEYERDEEIVRYADVIEDEKRRERFIETASCYIAAQKLKNK